MPTREKFYLDFYSKFLPYQMADIKDAFLGLPDNVKPSEMLADMKDLLNERFDHIIDGMREGDA